MHDRVRQEMKQVLSESEPISFLDGVGVSLLEEARQFFREAKLDKKQLVADGNSTLLLGWRGDWTNDGLSLLLTAHGLQTSNEGIALRSPRPRARSIWPVRISKCCRPCFPSRFALTNTPSIPTVR